MRQFKFDYFHASSRCNDVSNVVQETGLSRSERIKQAAHLNDLIVRHGGMPKQNKNQISEVVCFHKIITQQ